MEQDQLTEINSKLEKISNHYDFFKKKMEVLDKIETAILGNEYNKRGITNLLDNYEKRIDDLEKDNIVSNESIKENSKKISNWDKGIAAIFVAIVIFELTKTIVK